MDPIAGAAWTADIAVCLPGRECVDVVPAGGWIMQVTTALTPVSAIFAGAAIAALVGALLLIALALRTQWHGLGLRPWAAVLVTALLLVGLVATWSLQARLATVTEIYSDAYGQSSAPVPADLIASWPTVLAAGWCSVALGAVAIAAFAVTARLARHHKALTGRVRSPGPPCRS